MQSLTATTASVGSAGAPSSELMESRRSLSIGAKLAYVNQLHYAGVRGTAPGGDLYAASLPKTGDLPQVKKNKCVPPERRPSKDKERLPSKERAGSKESAMSGIVKPPSKTLQQKKKEAAILLEQKDPFEYWRKNEVGAAHLSNFQRNLKTNEGLSSLQGDMRGTAKLFKNFYMKELDADSLFELRSKYGPAGLNTLKQSEKKLETWKNENWGKTEEAEERGGTNRDLFHYFGAKYTGEQPALSDLSKLLQKSHTQGANLDKLAKEEEKRQVAHKAQLRMSASFCKKTPMPENYKNAAKKAGSSPAKGFHRT